MMIAGTIPTESGTIDLEKRVLGSLLQNRDAIPIVTGILEEQDFEDGRHRHIFSCFCRCDMTGAMQHVCDRHYLVELLDHVPTGALAVDYSEALKKSAAKRRVEESYQKNKSQLESGAISVDEYLHALQVEIRQL